MYIINYVKYVVNLNIVNFSNITINKAIYIIIIVIIIMAI